MSDIPSDDRHELPPRHLRVSSLVRTLYVTRRATWTVSAAAVFLFAAHSALSQGCHPENSWPCFVAFTHFRHSVCLMGCSDDEPESDFPPGTPLTDFQLTLALRHGDKIPYVRRGAGKIFMSAPLWMDYMAWLHTKLLSIVYG